MTPARIRRPAWVTMESYHQIPYVLVIGVVVVKDSKVQKVFPGKPIRVPVLASGRLDQIEIEPRTRSKTMSSAIAKVASGDVFIFEGLGAKYAS